MSYMKANSLIGLTDYDEGTNLSRYLISHGWNADHALSLEEVLDELEQGNYGLVVLDEEMLNNSQWSLSEYLEFIGPETAVLILTEPGSSLRDQVPKESCEVLQHPYTNESLRLAIERILAGRGGEEDYELDSMDTLDDYENEFPCEFELEELLQ